jgi:hypothetical protein
MAAVARVADLDEDIMYKRRCGLPVYPGVVRLLLRISDRRFGELIRQDRSVWVGVTPHGGALVQIQLEVEFSEVSRRKTIILYVANIKAVQADSQSNRFTVDRNCAAYQTRRPNGFWNAFSRSLKVSIREVAASAVGESMLTHCSSSGNSKGFWWIRIICGAMREL